MANVQLPAFFRGAAMLEAQAVEFHAHENQVINGLLQTADYARAVFTVQRPMLDEATIQQRVSAPTGPAILSRQPAPIMSFVTEEAVLRRPCGGRTVMRGQLEQLLHIGEMRNVELQVMPTGLEDHAGAGGPFALWSPRGAR